MNLTEKHISFVIPTYNGSKTLSKLAEDLISIFKNYKIEIVIVNDRRLEKTNPKKIIKNVIFSHLTI